MDGESATLAAVQQRRVYVIDANTYTRQSEPRLVHGLELFTERLHPEHFSGLMPEGGAAWLSVEQLKAPCISWTIAVLRSRGPDAGGPPCSAPYSPGAHSCANSGDLKTVLAMCMKALAGSTPT
jgi:hypothetical protein